MKERMPLLGQRPKSSGLDPKAWLVGSPVQLFAELEERVGAIEQALSLLVQLCETLVRRIEQLEAVHRQQQLALEALWTALECLSRPKEI